MKIISVGTKIINGTRKIVRIVEKDGKKEILYDNYSYELLNKYFKEYTDQLKNPNNQIDIKPEPGNQTVESENKKESETVINEEKQTEEVKAEPSKSVKPEPVELDQDIDINDYFIIKHKKAILRLIKTGLIIYGAYKIFSPIYADFKSMPNHVIIDEEKPKPQSYDVQEYYYNLKEEELKVR